MPKDKDDEKITQPEEEAVTPEPEAETPEPEVEVPVPEMEAPAPEAEKLEEEAPKGKKSKKVAQGDDTSTQDVDAVTIQPVEFMSFDHDENPVGEENKNLEMLLDIKLELTVELGRCELPIKKILELTRDSIVELDKIAGEPVSLYANGKHIANGEVVVIEDNFGLRITSIIEPEKRLKSLE